MTSHRRGFFKTLFAGALAAVLPKPKLGRPCLTIDRLTPLIKRIPDPLPYWPEPIPQYMATAYVENGHTMYELWPRPPFDFKANWERANRQMEQMMAEWAEQDMKFLAGQEWAQARIGETIHVKRPQRFSTSRSSENSFPAPDSPSPLS